MNIGKRGFTLIEILIVVAIIAILASVVLVGLGPTQQAGRDARRLSDLREVQNGLELFYQNCGFYPGGNGTNGNCNTIPSQWSSTNGAQGLGYVISQAVPNVGSIPSDPSANRSYGYNYATTPANGSAYVIGAVLENANNSAFQGYTAPNMTAGYAGFIIDPGLTGPTDCVGPPTDNDYCLTL